MCWETENLTELIYFKSIIQLVSIIAKKKISVNQLDNWHPVMGMVTSGKKKKNPPQSKIKNKKTNNKPNPTKNILDDTKAKILHVKPKPLP